MIGILDYGAGNIASVGFALERLGAAFVRVSRPDQAEGLDGLLFPGVGRARAATARLRDAGLWDLVRAWDRPLLGVCLGMQLLFEHSEEDDCPGLGILDGSVRRLNPAGLKVPHMGWNLVRPAADSFLGPSSEGPWWFYFVHGYAVLHSEAAVGVTDYGRTFVSAVRAGRVWGVQFHPERSGVPGAALLRRFMLECSPDRVGEPSSPRPES